MKTLEKISDFVGKYMAIIVLVIAAMALFVPTSLSWVKTSWVNYLLMVVMFGMGLTIKPDDFVIATGVQHTVREFTELAFANNGIKIEWQGNGIDEKGYNAKTGKMLVCVNPKWFRPTDVVNLLGNPTKARTVLGWDPLKTSYEQLCAIMSKHDRQLAEKEATQKLMIR